MAISRRKMIAALGSLPALAFPAPARAEPAAAPIAPPAPQRVGRLPPWPYGDSSTSPDTVLMFRGDGTHTFGGTGPIPEAAPKIVWSFRTPSRSNVVHGVPTVWAGTGWTGSAVKLGDYVYVGSVVRTGLLLRGHDRPPRLADRLGRHVQGLVLRLREPALHRQHRQPLALHRCPDRAPRVDARHRQRSRFLALRDRRQALHRRRERQRALPRSAHRQAHLEDLRRRHWRRYATGLQRL